MSRFDRMTSQDWAIRDAINDILQENNRPTSDYTYSAIPEETPTPSAAQSVQEPLSADSAWSLPQAMAPRTDYFALLNPGETPASALESKLSQMQSMPDLSTEPVSSEKWWAGDRPTYAESVAQLYRMQDSMTPEQFDAYAAQLDAAKNNPASGFYHNPYTGITSPYVDAISKLGIDVSGGINDEWIAKNQYLLAGARYTDAGTTPAAPTKTSTAAQNAAYYYYQIQRNYADTKEVLNEEAALKDDIAYWVGREDLNLSDDQILEMMDWDKKYKYLKGLKTAQSDGHVYNYTQPIDYNPDNLRGYVWAARNNGGTGNPELDAVNAALGRGNVWKENKEISDKLDYRSENYKPYAVKSTLDDEARYFGVKEFEPGWAEKAAKTIVDWNNPEDVKHWQKVEKAEAFTAQAEAEVKEIYNRIDTMIAAGITDPAVIEDGLWDKGLDGSAALTALKKLDASMVKSPEYLEDTTRPIDYRKQDVLDYINQKVAKATEKEPLPAFGMRVTEMMGTNIVHGNEQAPAQVDVAATVAPTSTPGVNPTDQPRNTVSATDRILNTPAPTATTTPVPTPTPTPTPTPKPVVDQTAQAVNAAQTKNVRDSAKTILATGTPDEKMVLSLAPTANAEGVAAEMAGSVQTGTANAGTLYETTAKQAQDYTAAHYMTAKMAIQHYDDLQARLEELKAQQAEVQEQYDQVQYQVDRGIVPGIAQTEVQINGETHVFTADYDPTSKEYIIHDSNPTDSAEVERQKADYANTLRYGLNMDETYAERDNQLLVAAESLNMELTAINQQVANAQKAVEGYKMRYDQAQRELKTSESMINAAAMQSVWKANPGMDLSTPEGQKAMAEALQKEGSLAASFDRLLDTGNKYEATTWSDATMYQSLEAQGADKEQIGKLAMEARSENQEKLDQLLNDEQQAKATGNDLSRDAQSNIDRKKAKLERDIKAADDYMVQFNPEFDATVSDVKKKLETDIQADKHQYSDLSRRVAMQAMGISPTDSDRSLAANARWESVENMLPDELNTYLWYLDEGGETAAHEYYARLTDPTYGVIPVRITNRSDEALAGFAQEHPVLAYDASILLSPAKVISGIDVARQLIFEPELNPRSPGLSAISGFGVMQETAKEKMLDDAGAEEGSIVRKIGRLGLDGLASGGESLVNGLLMGPLAGKISNKILSSVVGVIPMAVSAAGAEAADVKTRGGSDLQAGLTYGLTFATEMLSEAITYENIQGAYKGGVKGIKSAAAKLATNPFVEELLGEEAANVIEYVGDNVIMGDLSKRQAAITKYEETMSHADAVKEADKDFWRDVLRTGLTTLVSTGASQATSYAAGRLSSIGTGNTTQPSPEGQVRATALANGLPLDRTTQDMAARTVTMLTSSLNADKGSQVQALSAALFPVPGDAQGQRAAISAGLHMANQFGSEQAVAVAQDVILAAAQEGTDQQAVSEAMRIAALGQGEASAVLNKINQTGVEFGDVRALVDAAGRDAQNPAIADRMNAIIHNDRVASRTRDLIGQGALNGVKPYEQAYSQAKAQEAQTQQNLEAEQERAKAMGEHLQTVQAQHVEDPANPALAGAMKQAVKDVAGQAKVVGEYQQGLEHQQQKTQDAEKDLNRVREEAMTKVREQAMADVQAEEQAEAEEAAAKLEKAKADVAAKLKAEAEERAEKQKRIKEQYPNAPEGAIGFDKDGKPWFMGEYYSILPERGSDGYYIQDIRGGITLDEQERLKAAGLTYNTADGSWHGAKDINVIFDALADNQQQTPASNPNAGTVYTNDQVPVSYHWALVPASDLVTSNTDTGEANSAYPAELQPRDRTRAASQDQVAGMVRNLNPARLGESADAQNGAPIVGPDNVVESGNARTMAIRQAMASNPESAARYTQYVRDNAARFGLNPDDVTDNSVLVRVRDTDLDRVAFARAANESTTATYSPSENAQGDADRLTPRMMELFAPSDTGRLDTTENHAFALAFLNEIIPESERGAYMQDDGSISQQGYDRIRNAVFQRAYGSTALTQALTEDTDGSARNVMNALLKAAPRMMALQDAVDQGGVYNTGLAQKVAEAAQRYMQLKNAGMSVEAYLEQTAMPGIQTEDEATQAFMRLFEEYRRSGKKLSEALANIADAVEDAGDPRAVSFLGQTEAPPLTELIRQGVERMLRPRDLVSAYRANGAKVSPSLTPQQQQAQQQNQNRNTENVVSGQETIRQLTDALGITRDARVKKFLRGLRRTAAGYTMNNGIIHTRDFQGAKVAMHEIGHNLDVRLGLQDMVNQMGPTAMAQLAQDYSANIDPDFLLQYSQAEIPNELMAEFSYVWAMDRAQAVNWAGEDFVNQYERALQDHGWLRAMQTASEQMRRWADASGMDRAESMVRLEVPRKVQDKVNLNRARSIIADHTLPLQELADIVARASGNNQASANARELLLARPTLVKNLSDGNLYGTMLDMHGDVVRRADGTEYGSLADILENIDRRDEKAFNTYLLARLDIDRRAQGKGLFAEGIDSDALVREYEAQYSNFRDVSDRLYEWYNKFFETWLVDTGIVPRAQFDAMRATAPHYVPLHAADESADRPSGKQRTDGNPARVLERAFESDASKYNPVMGLVENIEKYVMTAKTIEALRAFDAQMMYALENQLDVGAIAEPAQHDMERINQGRAKRNIADAVNRVLTGMQQNGTVSQQDSQAVMDAIANVANFDYVVHDTATGTDVINIPMADGEVHSWTIYNPDLLKALTMTNNNGNISPIARKLINGISTITRALSANVTSRSLKFSGQNVFSDVETAATTGRTGHNNVLVDILAGARPVHMAKEIVAGLDLLRNKFAESALGERMGLETSERYDAFKRFGMLGSRYAFRDSKTQKETRNALYGGHKSFGEAILDVVKSPLNFVEAVSGFGEEMTRYNAFALSGFDLSTYEGRLQAAKANREATTDFSKFGSGSDSEAFKIANAAIPFINAQIQGIDKTLDTLHEIRNDPRRRAVLLGRVAINSLMMGAVTAAFRNIVWGDDEKESYKDLTDYEKTKFIHLFRWPDGTWFKMKRSQDMAVQAADLLGEYIGEVSSGYEGDAFADMANGAVEIIKNGMVSTDTSLQPFFDALNNQTWYGSDIDTYSDKKMSPTARYGVDTSKFGRVVSTLTGGAITPKAVDYAVKQFMGSAGTLGTAILDTAISSWDNKRFSGQALLNFLNDEVIGGYIVDPVYSNKVATTFYDGKEKLDFMQNEIKNGRTPEMFRSNLTQEEANKAAKELETMLSKGGAVYDANKQYSDIKKEYNAVMSDDTTLTPVQQAEKARDLRHQMNAALLTANAAMGDFFNKYGYNSIFDQAIMNTMNILSDDQNKAIPDSAGGKQSDYDSMPQTFKDDENEPYMQKSKAVYEATGERSALPHPQMKFTSQGVEYEIAPEDQDTFNSMYKTTYQKYVAANSAKWDAMTNDERLDVLNDAHNKARDTAKGWYKKKHNIK